VVDRVTALLRGVGDARRFGRTRTGTVPLPGAIAAPADLAAAVVSRDGHGLTPAVALHLAERYGSRLGEVLGVVGGDRRLAEPIVPALPDPRAEVLAAVQHEWAVTVEDVLRRRTQVALRDATGGVGAAADVAALMASALGWDAGRAQAAAETYVTAIRSSRRRWT
jgi:glycerol-3-phosphate dehydrogenase